MQAYLAEKFEKSLRVDRAGIAQNRCRVQKTDRRDGQRSGLPNSNRRSCAEPKIRALWDRGEPSPTYIYRRGDYLSPGRLVGPGVPSVLTDGKTPFEVTPPWPGAKKTGRRLALARWLDPPRTSTHGPGHGQSHLEAPFRRRIW